MEFRQPIGIRLAPREPRRRAEQIGEAKDQPALNLLADDVRVDDPPAIDRRHQPIDHRPAAGFAMCLGQHRDMAAAKAMRGQPLSATRAAAFPSRPARQRSTDIAPAGARRAAFPAAN